MKTPRALVLRAPGINCDRETAQACRLVGFTTDLVHINTLLNAANHLLDYDFLVIPGGFSYGDDLGAGTLLAKNLTIHLGQQLQQFIEDGRPLLGICNGFQALIRANLLPGPLPNHNTIDQFPQYNIPYTTVGADLSCSPPIYQREKYHNSLAPQTTPPTRSANATLTENASAQFECRWVTLTIQPGPCIFTQNITHPIELPIAHGEGQFVLPEPTLLPQLQAQGQIPLVYSQPGAGWQDSPQGELPYPYNPNGSIGNIAGICNAQGNVLGLMPHPERYVHALQHSQRRSGENGQGDGLLIFKNAYEYVKPRRGLSGTCEAHFKSFVPTADDDTYQPGPAKGVGRVQGCHFERVSRSPERSEGEESLSPGTEFFRCAQNDMADPDCERSLSARSLTMENTMSTSYTQSGVNIAAADHAKKLMRQAVQAAQGPEVLAGMGAFAGVFDASNIKGMRKPALVASTDGVGTKTLIAAQTKRYDTIGYDLVNHCVNDLLTQWAKPLFFMDYLAMGKLDPIQAATIVRSVAAACQEIGCTLLGGETAEMPDVYLPTAFDLAGTIVGIVEQDALVDNNTISAGDVLLGLPSSGLHTNGYSLARRVFAPYPLDTVFPELGEPLVDALLRPHRSYLRELLLLREHPDISIKGLAHITGGGFEGNLARILPPGRQAVIQTNTWIVSPLFQLIARLGHVTHEEMYRTFNMGMGMVLVISPESVEHAQRILPELLTIGYITNGDGVNLE